MQKLKEKVKSDIPDRCYRFGLDIIGFCDTLPNKRTTWVLSNQLLRSSTSIGANVIEAQASSSRREYKKFFEIALKSANESIYWLNLVKDSSISDPKKVSPLIDEARQLSLILGKSVITLKTLPL
jgi:four helix bundle protein